MARGPSKELTVLQLLESGDAYGLELVERSGGELKRGTVYVTLGRLEEKGLVAAHDDPDPASHPGMPRRRYRLTALGARQLRAERARDVILRTGRLPART